jgi:hypothetical protein
MQEVAMFCSATGSFRGTANAAANGFLLFGDIDHATSALAEILAEFVTADAVTGLFAGRRGLDDKSSSRHTSDVFLKKFVVAMIGQQFVHFRSQLFVFATRGVEKRGACGSGRLISASSNILRAFKAGFGCSPITALYRHKRKQPRKPAKKNPTSPGQICGEFLSQPRPGITPSPLCGSQRHPQRGRRLRHRHADEIPELDEVSALRIFRRQAIERFIDGQDLLCRHRDGDLRLVELFPLKSAAAFASPSPLT